MYESHAQLDLEHSTRRKKLWKELWEQAQKFTPIRPYNSNSVPISEAD